MEGGGREGAEVRRTKGGPGASCGFESRLASVPPLVPLPLDCLPRPSARESPPTPPLPEGQAVSPQLNVSFPSLVRLRKLRPTKMGCLARAQLWDARRLTGRFCRDLSTCRKTKQNTTPVRRSRSRGTLGLSRRRRPAQANDWERATVWDISGPGTWSPTAQLQSRLGHSPLRASVSPLRSVGTAGGPTLPTTTPTTSSAAWGTGPAPKSTRPRLALTSALTPPAPLATGSGRSAGLTLRLLPAAPRRSRSFPHPRRRGARLGGGGTTRAGPGQARPPGEAGGPDQPPGLRLRRFPPPGMRLPPGSKSAFTATSLPRARP